MIDKKKKNRQDQILIVGKAVLLLLALLSLIYENVFLWAMRVNIFVLAIILIFGKKLRQWKITKKRQSYTPEKIKSK